MHGTAFPLATPGCTAEEVTHHLVDAKSSRDSVTMRSVRAGYHVPLVEGGTYTHGARLLPLALMDRSRHDPFQKQKLHPLFESPNQQHAPIETK